MGKKIQQLKRDRDGCDTMEDSGERALLRSGKHSAHMRCVPIREKLNSPPEWGVLLLNEQTCFHTKRKEQIKCNRKPTLKKKRKKRLLNLRREEIA